jgi:hypothetical protein
VLYRFLGVWAVRRVYRLLTADDPRPLRERLTREAKKILVGAAITLTLIVLAVVAAIGVVIALAT